MIVQDIESNPSAAPWSHHGSRRRSGWQDPRAASRNNTGSQAGRNLCSTVIDQSDMAALKALKSANSSPASMGMGKRAR